MLCRLNVAVAFLSGILPMLKHVNHVAKRFIIYVFICLLAGFGIAGVTAFFH
ncbi:TPA: hypothetical protein ACNGY6_001629, partial [Klebsiella variicola subsp. variicola]